jgi:hypothetical protein
MAHEDKSKAEQNALKIAEWLAHHGTEFEEQGINEDRVAAAAGLSETEVAEALDRLENHEEVVRMPHALTIPPQLVLKPGRGWLEKRDAILGKESGG